MRYDSRVPIKLHIEPDMLQALYRVAVARRVAVSDVACVALDYFLHHYDPILLEGLPRGRTDDGAAA